MVRREVLPNGLRLLVSEMRSAPVVAMNLWVGVGSAQDPEGLPGLSHFVEHLLFKGVSDGAVVDVAREVQEAGGHLNAETSCDYTVYHQIVPSERWADVLAAQAAGVRAPAFGRDDVEAERGIIMEEMRSAENDPSFFVWRRLMELAFDRHAYRRPVVGTIDSLSLITPNDLRDHHVRNYVSGNILQVIVGDVDADEAVARARACLGGIPNGRPPKRAAVEDASAPQFRAFQYEGDIGQPYAAVAFRVPHALHPDVPVLDALSGLLGVGRSSRLRRTLGTSDGLVSDVGAGVVAFRGAGLLVVRAVAATPDVEAVLRGVFREVERLRSEPPSISEMEKNLRRLEAGYVLAHETADSIAHNLGFFETLGDFAYAEEYVDRLAAVTTRDIVRASREYLTPERATIVCYVPGAGHPPAIDRSAEMVETLGRDASTVRGVIREQLASWSPSSFARPQMLGEARSLSCGRTGLGGGGTLVTCESRALPIVSAALAFRGGFVDEPEELHGITYLMQKMAMLGTTTRSADRIADEVEELGTAVSSAVDRDGFGLGLTVVSKRLAEALSVLGDVIGSPSFPPDRLAAAKAEVLAEIGEIDDHQMQRAALLLLPLVFPCGPYGRPIRGTRESIKAIGVEDLTGWHERVCAGRGLIACFVGDVSANAARESLGTVLPGRLRAGAAGLSRDQCRDGVAEAGGARPGGVVEQDAEGSSQSVVAIGLAGPLAGTRDAVVARLITGALSMMGGRLWRALRERPPYAYHVGATQVAYRLGGATIGYVTASPGGEEAAVGTFLSELGRLAEDGLEERELERARRHLAGTLEISLMRGSTRAAAYAMAEVTGSGYERVEGMPRAVRTVTREEVVEVARRYLDPDAGFAKVVIKGDVRSA